MNRAVFLGDIPQMASILHRSWIAKKRTSTTILEAVASLNGALATKVSGAGGGGFLMLIVPTELRHGLITALNRAGGEAFPVKITEFLSESWGIPIGHDA